MREILDFLKSLLILILIVVICFVGYYAYVNALKYKGMTFKEIMNAMYLDFMEKGEENAPYADHPGINAEIAADYTWAMDYVEKQNIQLTTLEMEVVYGLYSGTLEYVCRGIDSIDANDVITAYYFCYGNGSVYVISTPNTASLDISPISLIVINADTVKENYRNKMLTKCNNVFSVTLYCGITNAIKYDLYSKLS